MESANSSRTYTAQTCKLQVTIVPAPSPGLARPTGDFTLQIDRTEDPNGKSIVLNGQLEQLDKLQQSVSQYEAQLVAQFPMGTTEHVAELVDDGSPEPIPEATVVNRLYPTQPSGLIKNLPGLRQKSPELPVENLPKPESNPFSALSISKLLSRSNPATSSLTAPDSPIPPKSVPSPTIDRSGTLPRLTAGDRPLEHKLYLSDNNSGRVLTLAQSQIFDLATALNEYTANKLTIGASSPVEDRSVAPPHIVDALVKAPPIEAIKFEAPKIEAVKFEAPKIQTPPIEAPAIKALKIETPPIEAPAIKAPKIETPPIEAPEEERGEKFSSIATTSALSRLPNLPTLPAKTSRKSYEYVDDSQPAFMSALPWVGAAALVVGVPLLLFGSNPDLLKDSMAKVKLPIDPQHMFDSKKGEKPSKTAKPPANPTGDGVANAATADLPKPWESKPVQPPAATTATVPGAPIPQPPGANQIGIAPLPPSIANVTEEQATAQNPPTAPVSAAPKAVASAPPKNQTSIGIAPNPLESKLPSIENLADKKQLPTAANPSTPPKTTKPATVATKPKTTKPATVAAKPKTNNSITSLPISVSSTGAAPQQKKAKVKSPNTGKIAVAPQPMPLPAAFDGMGSEPPLTPPAFPAPKADKPAPVKQQKKVVVKSKPKRAVVAKKIAKVTPLKTRQPKKVETIIPVQPADPATVPSEFANPPGMPQNTPETPPIVNEPQLQSNNNSNTDLFDSPSLKETKRYFQTKWRADSSQTTPLQYVIQVNGKSGLVQSVSPQGEAASTYLKKTGMLKSGQKLVSPTPGEGEQKIRVLLQPDGNVDTFVEP